MTRLLLIVTAVFEAATGLLLIVWPSAVLAILFGPASAMPIGPTGAQVAGVVLLVLGLGCWFARDREAKPAGRRMVATMLLYNVVIAAILAATGIYYAIAGIMLWAAIMAHLALAAWCVASLRRTSSLAGS